MVLGALLVALDQTIVSTALPTIAADLGGATQLAWVVTVYLFAQTVSVALAGRLGDLFGRNRVFRLSALVFAIGSALCSLAPSMTWLTISRAVQGAGGGGLLVTSAASIADVVPLPARGRYQGIYEAVLGATTVVGPLLGGVFTDRLSWRWAFFATVPIALVVVLVAAWTVPATRRGHRRVVDYPGIVLLAAASVGLTLATNWAGTARSWGSPTIVGLFTGSAVVLVLFLVAETPAAEPTLPIRLLRNPVFALATPLSFVVGFAMLGALTFVPLFLQYVQGVSATASGLRMLPMVAGLLIASTAAGNVVGRTGQYRAFPVAGILVIAVGLLLLSTMDASTPAVLSSWYLLVLGMGIGLSGQVLTLIVRNTADLRDLGVATSGVTYFRTVGSSFGVAVLGSIYAGALAPVPPGPAGPDRAATLSPEDLRSLPPADRGPVLAAYSESLSTVFLHAVPVALAGFVLALFLKQVPIRGVEQRQGSDPIERTAPPCRTAS